MLSTERLSACARLIVVGLAANLCTVFWSPAQGQWCAKGSCPACPAHGFPASTRQCFASQSACLQSLAQAKASSSAGATTYSGCDTDESAAPAAGGGTDALASKMMSLIEQARVNNQRAEDESARVHAEANATNSSQLQLLQGEELQRIQNASAEAQEAARRRKTLLAQMTGAINANAELGATGSGGQPLVVQPGTAFFGRPANPSGAVDIDGAAPSLLIPMPAEPETPLSTPAPPSQRQVIAAEYLRAADGLSIAQQQYHDLQAAKEAADRERQEAQNRYQELQAQASAPTQGQAAAPPADDKLAEAEKLLNEATDLDEKASLDLSKAANDVTQAKLDLNRADKARTQAENAATHTGQSP